MRCDLTCLPNLAAGNHQQAQISGTFCAKGETGVTTTQATVVEVEANRRSCNCQLKAWIWLDDAPAAGPVKWRVNTSTDKMQIELLRCPLVALTKAKSHAVGRWRAGEEEHARKARQGEAWLTRGASSAQ